MNYETYTYYNADGSIEGGVVLPDDVINRTYNVGDRVATNSLLGTDVIYAIGIGTRGTVMAIAQRDNGRACDDALEVRFDNGVTHTVFGYELDLMHAVENYPDEYAADLFTYEIGEALTRVRSVEVGEVEA
jgi:hypothetical protein